jgi:hypothetical protein
VYLDGISFWDSPALASISMPKLNQIDHMAFYDILGTSFDFPSFLNASSINLSGSITKYFFTKLLVELAFKAGSLNVPLLVDVDTTLSITMLS